MEHNRKNLRLREYNDCSAGYYFVTVCTYQKQMLFGSISPVGARHDSPTVQLSLIGNIVRETIENLSIQFPLVSVPAT